MSPEERKEKVKALIGLAVECDGEMTPRQMYILGKLAKEELEYLWEIANAVGYQYAMEDGEGLSRDVCDTYETYVNSHS